MNNKRKSFCLATLLVLAAFMIQAPALADTGFWETTGSMETARCWHAAVLLQDGRVLVVGGMNNNIPLSSAEIYDPTTGTWTTTASLATARVHPGATLLQDGRVLVVGGRGGIDGYASAEIYNPATGTWSPTGSLSTPRFAHTTTLLQDGRVLVAGGIRSGSNWPYGYASAEIYDPATGTWSVTGSLINARFSHSAHLLKNGWVLVVGGAHGTHLASVELYDPNTGIWSATGSLAITRNVHAAALLKNGGVLVIGDDQSSLSPWPPLPSLVSVADIYDPDTGIWSPTGAPPIIRYSTATDLKATLLPNGKVLLVGGSAWNNYNEIYPTEAELFDPETGTWGATGSLVTGRAAHTVTLLKDGRVLVVGGYNANHLNSAELYSNSQQPPILDPIGNRTVNEGEHLQFTISATDPDGNALTYSASNLPAGAIFDPANQTFNWTPTFDQAGTYQVLFTVTDNGSPPLSASEEITITVGNVNRPPVLNPIGNKDVLEGQTLQFAITATDPDGDAVTYSASNLPAGASFDSGGGVFSWTPGFDQAGSYTNILFTATDNGTPAKSTSESITITVGNVNRPPQLNPIGNKTVNENELLEFAVTGTDPDGDALTYTATNLPSGATFDPVTQTFRWTPGYEQAGNYPDIEFSAMDNGSPMGVAVELITITVGNVNRAPVFSSVGTQQVLENQLLQFYVEATDYDGNYITYSYGPLPRGASFDTGTRLFSWTPDNTQQGSYVVDFYATDNGIPNLQSELAVVINVGDVPTPCELANRIINTVLSLNLAKNVENSYLANLKKVCPFIEEGKKTPALNQLNAFIHKVQTDISKGNIGSADGAKLIQMANELIAKLQG